MLQYWLVNDFDDYEGKKCYTYLCNTSEVCPWCKNKETQAGKTVQWEWFYSKNGKIYDLIGTPIKNSDGSISTLEIFRDITSRKKSEEELLKYKNHLEELVESLTLEIEKTIRNLQNPSRQLFIFWKI